MAKKWNRDLSAPLVAKPTRRKDEATQIYEGKPELKANLTLSESFSDPENTKPKLKLHTGLFKKKNTLSKINFTKSTDAKSISCVRMERKYLKVLISTT
jgi:hypothetical protein